MVFNKNILKEFISEKDCVLVGVSGGADSMCLIDLINRYRKDCVFKFYAVHINHNLRNEEALRDQNFVEEFCEKNNIPFIKESIDTLGFANKNLKTVEQAGRELRYQVFEKLMKTLNANKLFVAHHKDDQAETVLMHILRGASLKGASGIKKQQGYIYRPLLNFSRKQIEKYNKENGVDYIIDSSNKDIKYTRNYIRNVVMPAIEKAYPNATSALCSFAEDCLVVENFIDSQVQKEYVEKSNDKVYINIEGLRKNFVLASRLIKFSLESLGVFADIEKKHIVSIINLSKKENGKSINLTNGLVAYKEYNFIVILKQEENVKTKIDFNIGCFDFNGKKITIEKIPYKKDMAFEGGCLFLDYDKIPKDVCFRTREVGDSFKKFGSGTKSLSDYFIDKKVSKRKRDNILLLASGSKVLCVVDYEISDDVKITSNTKNIIKIS